MGPGAYGIIPELEGNLYQPIAAMVTMGYMICERFPMILLSRCGYTSEGILESRLLPV